MPAAMTGPVRRVGDSGSRWQIQIRELLNRRFYRVTRSFGYADRDAALRDFDTHVHLADGQGLYATGRYRLVLIDTEGQR